MKKLEVISRIVEVASKLDEVMKVVKAVVVGIEAFLNELKPKEDA